MRTIAHRLLLSLVSLMLLFALVFVMIRMIPGDPARLMAGISASETQVAQIRTKLGLDQPIVVQFERYLGHMVRGDLGQSIRSNQPVFDEIVRRFPATLRLATTGMLIAIGLGVTAGILAALYRRSLIDVSVTSLAVGITSIPAFWLALLLIDAFAIRWRLLPSSGPGPWQHLVLPAIVVASTQVGMIARLTRSALIEVLQADYIRTARAKGLPGRLVIWRHALWNAAVPVITVIALQLGLLLGGAVVTETIFRWPGIGRLLVDSVLNRDYPMIQGLVLFFGASFILLNIAADVLNSLVDPRLRRGSLLS